MYKLAVLVSGGGTNLQAILDRITDGSLPGIEVAVVIASRKDIGALARAGKAGIPCHVVARVDYPDRLAWDSAMAAVLRQYRPDLIVLAGYLSLLGPEVLDVWHNRVINVHPSLIPAFCGPGLYGLKVHEAVLGYGVKITGATVHIVDREYDSGPIIMQKPVAVLADDTPQTLQKRVMAEAEQVILPQVISYFSRNLVVIENRKTRILEEEEQ